MTRTGEGSSRFAKRRRLAAAFSIAFWPVQAGAAVVSAPAFQGAVAVAVDPGTPTARATVERIGNGGCLVSGPLTLQAWAAIAFPPAGQFPSGTKLFEVPVAVLLPGQFVSGFDTGDLPIALPSSSAASDVVLVLAEQQADGTWLARDARDAGWRFLGTAALLSQGRVLATARYRNPYDAHQPVPRDARPTYADDEFGFFWFTSPANAEIYVKALGDNDRSWIQLFASGTTNFEYSVSWVGCGQAVRFEKPAFGLEGYANAQGIDKSRCLPQCSRLDGGAWTASISNSCGQSDTRKFVTVVQSGCDFTFTIPGFSGIVATGNISGNLGAFRFVQDATCTGAGTGTFTVQGAGSVSGSFSGNVPTDVRNCCGPGPLSGSFTLSR